MKADLYVQGHFWATIDLPADSLLALLARGMLAELDGVTCSISLRIRQPTTYPPGAGDTQLQGE